MSTLLIFIIFIVDKHFEPERVVLVLSYGEPIIRQKKSVSAASIAVQKLVSFSVTCPMTGAHCEIDIRHVWLVPFLEVFLEFKLFIEGKYALTKVLLVSEFVQFAFYIPARKCLVPIQKIANYIIFFLFLFAKALHTFVGFLRRIFIFVRARA